MEMGQIRTRLRRAAHRQSTPNKFEVATRPSEPRVDLQETVEFVFVDDRYSQLLGLVQF
jgi:hypothetical protein